MTAANVHFRPTVNAVQKVFLNASLQYCAAAVSDIFY